MKPSDLKKTMEEQGWTAPALATLLEVHVTTVYRSLSGESKISKFAAKEILRLANKSGVAA